MADEIWPVIINDVCCFLFLERPYPPLLVQNSIVKTKTSITISWKAPFNGNSEILSYEIEYEASTYQSRKVIVPITAKKTSYTITGLEPYTSYEIRVRARNALGPSGSSNVAVVDTDEDGEIHFLYNKTK